MNVFGHHCTAAVNQKKKKREREQKRMVLFALWFSIQCSMVHVVCIVLANILMLLGMVLPASDGVIVILLSSLTHLCLFACFSATCKNIVLDMI